MEENQRDDQEQNDNIAVNALMGKMDAIGKVDFEETHKTSAAESIIKKRK
ncbi:MAG: hypothetical protein KH359_10620 [Clostridiales bacterium]|nr:hypothetical protein [Proteus hauseri]MBS6521069.1 hypothetical protein [Clostridiales bacterium]